MTSVIFGLAIAVLATPALSQTDKENLACEKAIPTHYPSHGIGTATMLADGTICVLLNPYVDEESGVELDEKPLPMLVVFPPSHHSYSAAKKEIGKLRPGETKVIRRYLKAYPDMP